MLLPGFYPGWGKGRESLLYYRGITVSQGVALRWDIGPFQGRKNKNPKPRKGDIRQYRRALPCAGVLGPFRAGKTKIPSPERATFVSIAGRCPALGYWALSGPEKQKSKALKGRHSSAQGIALLLSIPNIPFIIFNRIVFKDSTIFILKRSFAMVFVLIRNVIDNIINI
jgi:hypothetical protein